MLGLWLLAASVRAHPDYLADFNEIARKRPEHFLLTSDLDYGQDVGRSPIRSGRAASTR